MDESQHAKQESQYYERDGVEYIAYNQVGWLV